MIILEVLWLCLIDGIRWLCGFPDAIPDRIMIYDSTSGVVVYYTNDCNWRQNRKAALDQLHELEK